MSEKAHDLLIRGVASAKAKQADEARFFLEWVIRTESSLEQRADAFFWLGEISEDPEEKRAHLLEALGCRPNHYQAQRSLAILDGRLDAQDIIDPDKPPAPLSDQGRETKAQRFVCPQCGGRMTFSPDGRSLNCDYCAQRQSIAGNTQDKGTNIASQDFTIAMATAKGHHHPVATHTFECQACGAVFLLAPETASLKCAYCTSVYVVEQTETRQLLPPESLIPFNITEAKARQTLVAWFKQQRLPDDIQMAAPLGLYFPAWLFTISGPLPWDCQVPDNNDMNDPGPLDGWKTHSGIELVAQDNILVSASAKVPDEWISRLDHYNFDQLMKYDPAFLANWPAESYQITLADASLEARSMILDRAQVAVKAKIPAIHKDLHVDSKDLMVESFNLILLPLWLSNFRYEHKRYPIIVNGQTGKAWGRKPGGGVRKWLASLFKDE